jgi:hypothetical protein
MKTKIYRWLLDRKFVTEIRSKEGVLHFRRWRLIETSFFRLYVHELHQSDKDAHLHSHPWNFITWVIKGGYTEELENSSFRKIERFQLATHNAEDFHRITLDHFPSYTLFIAYGEGRPWGYRTELGMMPNDDYRKCKGMNK